MKSKSAFTLLEVVLAISILATMTLLSTVAITRALKARTKIQAEVDDVSALRDSLRLLRSDVHLAFHHRDFEKEILDLSKKSSTATPGSNPTATAPGSFTTPASTLAEQTANESKRGDPSTNFFGNETEMNFVTMNTGRMSSAVVQADFVEVGYSLKDCKNLTANTVSKCLYRRVQNIVDDDVKTGGNEMVLLENVSEFKLRYIGETKQDWVTLWNSQPDTNDGGTRGRYPDSIEVSLGITREVEKKERVYSMQLVIPIHFPNNAPLKGSGGGTGVQTGSGSSEQGGALDR